MRHRLTLFVVLVGFGVASISCATHQRNSPPMAGARTSSATPVRAATAPSLPEMIENARRSVVGIVVVFPSQDVIKGAPQPPLPNDLAGCHEGRCLLGTGFFVNDHGDVVTASHVADNVAKVLEMLAALHVQPAFACLEVDVPNYEGKISAGYHNYSFYRFRVAAEDKAQDIAVLSPTTSDLFKEAPYSVPPVMLADPGAPHIHPTAVTFDTKRPRDGEDIFVCGYPLGAQDVTTTSGHVANGWASGGYTLDISATFGNSGGPVFLNKNQAVIGMLIRVQGSDAGGGWTAIALPSSSITGLLSQKQITWKPASAGEQ